MRAEPTIWPIHLAPKDLPSGQIHVWRADIEAAQENNIGRLGDILSDDERQRAARFSLEKPRIAYTVARATLRLLLGHYLGHHPADLRFAYGEHGKPALVTGDLQFNLSHSGTLVLLAFAADRPVGVDIEFRRQRVDNEAIARRFFAADEVEALQGLPLQNRQEAFFRIWTRKEAYLKALGDGITVALDSFSVNLDQEAALRRPAPAAAQWRLHHIEPGTGYTGAVCAPGLWQLSCRHWDPAQCSI
jgi:4'-phosphopantetheinyl transferase